MRFSYVISNSVVYLCIAAKSYPRKLAFSYLDELSKEFERSYSSELSNPNLRPYAFVKFDTFVSVSPSVISGMVFKP
jgi:vesicle transport protein SEC22